MHPMLRPPFSPACFLQKFRDTRKPPLKLKAKYTVIPRHIQQEIYDIAAQGLYLRYQFFNMHNRVLLFKKIIRQKQYDHITAFRQKTKRIAGKTSQIPFEVKCQGDTGNTA